MPNQGRTSHSVARYVAAWLAATAVVVAIVAAVSRRDAGTVGVPPLAETRLGVAARHAGCRLLGARLAAQAQLQVTGPASARPTPAGVYERSQPADALLAAIRRGTVVIEFRGQLPDGALDELRAAQALVPEGTILAPSGSAIRYAVAVRAYRHALACPRFTPGALDALRLFRGRFLGTSPGRD